MAFGDLIGSITGEGTTVTTSNLCTTVHTSSAISTGDLIYVCFAQGTQLQVTGITDDLGNTYTACNAGTDAGNYTARAFYSIATNSGTITTITAVSSSTFPVKWTCIAAFFRGPFGGTPGAIDRNPTNLVDTTSPVSPYNCPTTGALTQANEVVVHWIVSDVFASGYANPSSTQVGSFVVANPNGIVGSLAYRVVAATTSVTPQFTSPVNPTVTITGTTTFKRATSTVLVTSGLAVPAPTFDTAAFVQLHALGVNELAVSPPTLGTATLSQKHVFVANGAAAGQPAFGSVGVFISRIFAAPPAMASGVPAFGTPALGQKYVLTAAWFPLAPTLGAGTLGQKHVLPAALFPPTGPQLGVASFSAGRQLLAASFAVPAPTFATATFSQHHQFFTNGYVFSAPILGTPTPPLINRILTATSFANSAPSMTVVPLRLNDTFPPAPNLVIGYPVLGSSQIEILARPEVWLRHRLKRWSNDPNAEFYDEDGTEDEGPVQQAIFANLNDEIELTISSPSLVGRLSPGRGPAETVGLNNLRDFASDPAAASGGIPVGGLYRTGSVLKIRVA